jgi:hypothetical protein
MFRLSAQMIRPLLASPIVSSTTVPLTLQVPKPILRR